MGKCLINKNSFINIQPFMVVNLDLSGVSLLIYALIYGHTVNKGVFFGSLEYISQWCNCSTRNVTDCIKKLVEKKLIRVKRTEKGTFYMASPVSTELPKEEEETFENPFDNEDEETSKKQEESSCKSTKKFPENEEKTSTNNLVNKLENKQDINSKSHCGKATKSKETKKNKESFPKDYYTQVYDTYFANCKILHEQGVLLDERPKLDYDAAGSVLNKKFSEYGLEDVLKAVRESVNHYWLTHDSGYNFFYIFGKTEFKKLLSGEYKNFNRQPNRQSYQQKQWTDDHLIL